MKMFRCSNLIPAQVLALGGASLWFVGERTEGENSDSADIALPAAQTELAEAVAATGKPLVVVLVQGRAYALPEVVRNAPAIVVSSYGGPFGPKAVAEVLFGAGVVMAIAASLLGTFVALIYNLIADIVGGVEVVLAEKRI